MSVFGPRTGPNRIAIFFLGACIVAGTPFLIYFASQDPSKNFSEKVAKIGLGEVLVIMFFVGWLAMIWALSKTEKVDLLIAFFEKKLGTTLIVMLVVYGIISTLSGLLDLIK